MENILISIVVPVYNTQRYLRHCLDTLVYQTYDNIEIMVVNDSSPDSSETIIQEYRERYPNKVRSFIIPNSGLSGAREFGLSQAIGEYVYFVDSDDYLAYDACEQIANELGTQQLDMIFVPIVRRTLNGEQIVYNELSGKRNIETAFLQAACSYYSAAFRVEFLKKFLPMPRMWYEDMASTRTILSYAKKIGYVKRPVYYYIEHEGTITASLRDLRTLDSKVAVNKIIDECNPTYIDYVSTKAAQRIILDLQLRWFYADAFIENMKSRKRYFLVNPILQGSKVYPDVKRIIDLPDVPMPCVLYVGGFGKENLNVEDIKERAFWGEGEVIVLDGRNCDVKLNEFTRAMFEQDMYEELNTFFAVLNIYQKGGIYVDADLIIEAPLNCLRYYKAFFGFKNSNIFTTKIFGGMKGSKIFKYLLNSYNYSYPDKNISIEKRIRNILVAVGGIRLNGCTQILKEIAVFSSRVFVLPTNRGFAISHDNVFRGEIFDDIADYLDTIGEEPAPFVLENVSTASENLTTSKMNTRIDGKDIEKYKQQAENYKKQVEEIKQTFSWRITAPIRKIRAIQLKRKKN